MTQSISAEATLLSAIHSDISKRTNVVSILVSAVISLVGVLLVYFSLDINESSSTMSMALLTLGTILILVSLYRIFWKSSEVVYIPTGSVISEGSCYTDTDDLATLRKMLEKKSFEGPAGVSFKHSGNGRMDYMVSKDGKFAAVQLFRFVPYTYEAASGIYYLKDAEAKAFKHYIETHNN